MSDPYALKKSDLLDPLFAFEIMDSLMFFKIDNPDATLKEACADIGIKAEWVRSLAQKDEDWREIYEMLDEELEPKLPRITLK